MNCFVAQVKRSVKRNGRVTAKALFTHSSTTISVTYVTSADPANRSAPLLSSSVRISRGRRVATTTGRAWCAGASHADHARHRRHGRAALPDGGGGGVRWCAAACLFTLLGSRSDCTRKTTGTVPSGGADQWVPSWRHGRVGCEWVRSQRGKMTPLRWTVDTMGCGEEAVLPRQTSARRRQQRRPSRDCGSRTQRGARC